MSHNKLYCTHCGRHTNELVLPDGGEEEATTSYFCATRCMIGQKVRVFWPVDEQWYCGTVVDFDQNSREHQLQYSDGDQEWVKLETVSLSESCEDEDEDDSVDDSCSTSKDGALRQQQQTEDPLVVAPLTPRSNHMEDINSPHTHTATNTIDNNNNTNIDDADADEYTIPSPKKARFDENVREYDDEHGLILSPLRSPVKRVQSQDTDVSHASLLIDLMRHNSSCTSESQQQHMNVIPPYYPPPPNMPDTMASSAAYYHLQMQQLRHPGMPLAPPRSITINANAVFSSPLKPSVRTVSETSNTSKNSPEKKIKSEKICNKKNANTADSVIEVKKSQSVITPERVSSAKESQKQKSRPKAWAKTEDQLLLELVKEASTPIKWSHICQSLPGRTGKQCRERYVNHLNPRLKTSEWSASEDATIFHLYNSIGSQWATMSKMLPGRTDNGIKNRFHNLRRQLVKDEDKNTRLHGTTQADEYETKVRSDRMVLCEEAKILDGKISKLFDVDNSISLVASQATDAVQSPYLTNKSYKVGSYRQVHPDGEQCNRCGFFAPSSHCGRVICNETGWCESCSRIPTHFANNILRSCASLRKANNPFLEEIIRKFERSNSMK